MPTLQFASLRWRAHGHEFRLADDGGDLTVESGEVAVVYGPSPAVRSLVDVLVGLADSASGEVLVSGQGIRLYDLCAIALEDREIGFIPAGGGLLPHLTVRQNIAEGGRRPRRSGFLAHTRKLNLGGFLDHRPEQLAADERLKVAIARALVHRPHLQMFLIEDASGHPPVHSAVSDLRHPRFRDRPVLIVTDDRHRVATLTDRPAREVIGAAQP